MPQFLALITTFDQGARPDNTLPQPPLGIWGGGNVPMPTPPMAPGGMPPGIWGGSGGLPGGGNYPSQGLPGQQPGIDNTLPGQPPGIWGGPGSLPGGGNYPSQGLPGPQPTPTPPIYFPPPTVTPPIVIPPDLPEEIPDLGPVDWKAGWTAQTGWIVVGVPNNPVPTPSRR